MEIVVSRHGICPSSIAYTDQRRIYSVQLKKICIYPGNQLSVDSSPGLVMREGNTCILTAWFQPAVLSMVRYFIRLGQLRSQPSRRCRSEAGHDSLPCDSKAQIEPEERASIAQVDSPKRKSPGRINDRGFGINAWQCPTFAWGDPTLSSALFRFTSEFGMGSGGSRTLLLPSKLAG